MGCAGRQCSWLIWIAFSSGDQVPSDLPLETVPRPPHLEGEEVRAWEFHQMVVVEDQSASLGLAAVHCQGKFRGLKHIHSRMTEETGWDAPGDINRYLPL